jgi:hypothetical protein
MYLTSEGDPWQFYTSFWLPSEREVYMYMPMTCFQWHEEYDREQRRRVVLAGDGATIDDDVWP